MSNTKTIAKVNAIQLALNNILGVKSTAYYDTEGNVYIDFDQDIASQKLMEIIETPSNITINKNFIYKTLLQKYGMIISISLFTIYLMVRK